MTRRLRSRAGQIIIPALLLFPTMFLFVYLLYETAKLSREKIRHQFAIDSAAFVEMTNYSDFLNRTAYVNGAFPMRIFEEGYDTMVDDCTGPPDKHDPCPPSKSDYPGDGGDVSYADVLYKNGAFPRSQSGKHSYGSGDASWDIEYSSARQQQMSDKALPDPFLLFTLQDANWFWHPYTVATQIYQLYVQIYSLLGSVESAQKQVLKRLSDTHSFMSKSYWLNTGESGDALVAAFRTQIPDFNSQSVAQAVCQRKLIYWGNTTRGGGGVQPYVPQYSHDDGAQDVDLAKNGGGSPDCPQPGLFQMMWVDPNVVKKLAEKTGGSYPGIELRMPWVIPNSNYWNVDFYNEMNKARVESTLHTTISLGSGDPSQSKPSVWPDPTPKFQVRQFP
ncbi:MAG: hypothetical protein KGJ84_11100 [Elusimicrobia bacterium]|nr:hypothetical protein [Elusimicrobiota bacterium]